MVYMSTHPRERVCLGPDCAWPIRLAGKFRRERPMASAEGSSLLSPFGIQRVFRKKKFVGTVRVPPLPVPYWWRTGHKALPVALLSEGRHRVAATRKGGVSKECMRRRFNEPIVGVVSPASLQQLLLKVFFKQAIGGVVWPSQLQQRQAIVRT